MVIRRRSSAYSLFITHYKQSFQSLQIFSTIHVFQPRSDNAVCSVKESQLHSLHCQHIWHMPGIKFMSCEMEHKIWPYNNYFLFIILWEPLDSALNQFVSICLELCLAAVQKHSLVKANLTEMNESIWNSHTYSPCFVTIVIRSMAWNEAIHDKFAHLFSRWSFAGGRSPYEMMPGFTQEKLRQIMKTSFLMTELRVGISYMALKL